MPFHDGPDKDIEAFRRRATALAGVPTDDPLSEFQSRASRLRPPKKPGLLRTFGSDVGKLARGMAPLLDPARWALDREAPEVRSEDILPAARAATSLAFPIGTAAETVVGGTANLLAGKDRPYASAYEEGAFRGLSRLTGLEDNLNRLQARHPVAGTALEAAGTILTGGAAELGVRAGARRAGRTLDPTRGLSLAGVDLGADLAGFESRARALPDAIRGETSPYSPIASGVSSGYRSREAARAADVLPTQREIVTRRLASEGLPPDVTAQREQRATVRGIAEDVRVAYGPEEATRRLEEAARAGVPVAEPRDALHDVAQGLTQESEPGRGSLILDRTGSARSALLGQVAATGTGATVGAAVDNDNRLRGALIGGAAGAGLSAAVLRATAKAPKALPGYLTDPDVQTVLGATVHGQTKAAGKSKLVQYASAPGKLARSLYTRTVDQLEPLREFGRVVGKSERLSHEVSRASGWRGGAQVQLENDFRQVLAGAKDHEEGVVALATAERALELGRNGMPEKGVDLLAAERTVQKLGQVPEVRAGVDQLRGYYRSLLDRKRDAGVLSQEQYDAIVAKGEFYVPFVRDLDESIPSAGGGKLVNRGTGVRKMKDERASSAIRDPFEQAIADTYETHRTIAKQRVTNLVSQIVEQDPEAAAPFVRRVQNPDQVRHGRLVQANVAGTRESYEVLDEDLFDAWAAYDTRTQGILIRALAPFKRALQTTVTLMPDFAIRNAVRDNAQSAIQYPFRKADAAIGAGLGAATGAAVNEDDRLGGALVGAGFGLGGGTLARQAARTGQAMGDIIGNRAIYREWMSEGGSGMSEFYGRPEQARKLLKQLRSDKTFWETVRPIRRLQDFGRMVEEAPRLARYKHLRAAGKDVPESIYGSRDISLDFANIGSDKGVQGLASTTAFFNAKIQGWDKLARLLKSPKTWAVGAATLTAPSIALWSVNKDNPEYWSRPQWERNLFWLVPRAEGGFYRVPKPFEVGTIFASIPERILDYAYQKDPETLEFALKDMLNTTAEGTFPVPTALEPVIENVTNQDRFRNRPIVGPGLERLPAELQYDDRTSSAALGLSKVIPGEQSPQKLDNLLRGYTGNAGREGLELTSKLARATGLDARNAPPDGRVPLLGSFTTRDDQTSDMEMAIRRRFEEAEKAHAGALALAKRGESDVLDRFIEKNVDQLGAYDRLKILKQSLDDLSEQRRTIAQSPMSGEEKRRMLAEINRAMSELLRDPEILSMSAAPN